MRIKIGAKFSPRTAFLSNDQTQKAILNIICQRRNDQEQQEEGINRTSLTQELQS